VWALVELAGGLRYVTALTQTGKGKVKGRTSTLSWLARAKAKQLAKETKSTTEGILTEQN